MELAVSRSRDRLSEVGPSAVLMRSSMTNDGRARSGPCRRRRRRRHRSRSGGGWQCHGAPTPRARRADLAKLDRLQERRADRNAVSLGGGEAQARGTGERRRVERRIAAGLGDASRFGKQFSRRIHEQSQRHVPFDLLLEERRRVGDRHVGIQRYRRFRLGRRRRLARLRVGLRRRAAAPDERNQSRPNERPHELLSLRRFCQAAKRFNASSGDNELTSNPSNSSSNGSGAANKPSCVASSGEGGRCVAT